MQVFQRVLRKQPSPLASHHSRPQVLTSRDSVSLVKETPCLRREASCPGSRTGANRGPPRAPHQQPGPGEVGPGASQDPGLRACGRQGALPAKRGRPGSPPGARAQAGGGASAVRLRLCRVRRLGEATGGTGEREPRGPGSLPWAPAGSDRGPGWEPHLPVPCAPVRPPVGHIPHS